MTTNDTRDRGGIVGGALTVALLVTLAVQNAVPPMATDMYSAAFPQITVDLATNSTMLGFTLTTFFVGYASEYMSVAIGGTAFCTASVISRATVSAPPTIPPRLLV